MTLLADSACRRWLSQRYYRAKHGALNAARDLWDHHLRGYCCAAPSGVPGAPGFCFWRCNLHRGHAGAHRSLDYIWHDPLAEKLPIDNEPYSIYAPRDQSGRRLDRYSHLTRRQKRQRDTRNAMRDEERRANAR